MCQIKMNINFKTIYDTVYKKIYLELTSDFF